MYLNLSFSDVISLIFFLFFFFNRFEELVKKFKVEYHAGGSTQNSVKVAQVCLLLKINDYLEYWVWINLVLCIVYCVCNESHVMSPCDSVSQSMFSGVFLKLPVQKFYSLFQTLAVMVVAIMCLKKEMEEL